MPDTPMGSAAVRPRWLRAMGALFAVYAVVLLGVFVDWDAALVGCMVGIGVDVARG